MLTLFQIRTDVDVFIQNIDLFDDSNPIIVTGQGRINYVGVEFFDSFFTRLTLPRVYFVLISAYDFAWHCNYLLIISTLR